MDAPSAVSTSESTAFRGTIVALGGGGFSMSETGESAIDDELLQMATRRAHAVHQEGTGTASLIPHVCFVPTASGDSRDYIERFEAAFEARARTHVLSLFGQSPWDYQDPAMLLDMDLIYVGGGSTANLLSLWRRHGVDQRMREAAAGGTSLAGISAGANCWFEASSTDSFGPLAPLNDGLGFLRGSACPHFHGEPGRKESFREWIAQGRLPGPGIAIDDHAAVVYVDGAATSVMVESAGAQALVVDTGGRLHNLDEHRPVAPVG
ncbi:Type 1 glutamine amidotransferase-like domain-containing protein [Brevibacterium permense]|uniref:Type 1 glutamine amidotransferase-like domain-containing protein n=1 Tax=Brevibacterium permense TaxID=234834 RepID=A0ABN2AQR7_9MICO